MPANFIFAVCTLIPDLQFCNVKKRAKPDSIRHGKPHTNIANITKKNHMSSNFQFVLFTLVQQSLPPRFYIKSALEKLKFLLALYVNTQINHGSNFNMKINFNDTIKHQNVDPTK